MKDTNFKIQHLVEETTDRDTYHSNILGTTYNVDGLKFTVAGIESYAKAYLSKGDKVELTIKVSY